MNFLDLLKSIEQAVYEIAMWVILIPKTLFKVLTKPSSIQAYVHDELAKDDKEQFLDQMSPVIFWLLIVIIPAFLIVNNFITQDTKDFIGGKHENYLFYITSALVGFLLCPALVISLFEKRKFDKKSFREPFYVQCYIQAPFALLVGSACAYMKYIGYDFDAMDQDDYVFFFNKVNGYKDLFMILVFGLGIYLAWVEAKVIMNIFKSVKTTILILVICLFLSGFIMLATGGIGYVLFFSM